MNVMHMSSTLDFSFDNDWCDGYHLQHVFEYQTCLVGKTSIK